MSASTPVEVLLLSKYDVFHRLSRSARETLRAAAQSHAESIVYLDRFHKTQKWEAYKQKVLREHVNHERIEKILPPAVRGASKGPTRGPPAKLSQSRQATATTTISSTSKTSESERVSRPSTGVTLPRLPLPPPSGDQCPESSRTTISNENTARQALVPANELLLLAQEAKAMKKCLNPDQTLGNYVTSFNVDAPPSAARQRQLDSVLAAEERRQAEVLKEGNPLAFFDIKVVEKQVCTSWNRTTRSLEVVEQGDDEDQTPETSRSSSVSPLRRSSSRSLKITSHALSQLLQENFIFSRPAGRKPQGHEGRKARLQQHKVNPTTSIRKPSTSPSKAHSPSRFTDRTQIESVSETDYVVFVILDESSDERSEATFVPKKSPAFQILQTARSLAAVRDAAERFQDSVGVTNLKYFALPLKTYALMPRADRSKVVEERLQLQQVAETNSPRTRTLSISFTEESTGSLHSTGDGGVHFASFQQVAVAPVPSASNNNEVRPSIPGSVVDSTDQTASTTQSNSLSPRKKTSASSTRSKTFAVASVVLSKLEVAQSQFDEPFVAVHALFASEIEAVAYAMNLKPAQLLKSSMLCIFPVGKWIYLEHAHDWCVQVETNKREKRAPSLTGASSTATRSRRLSLVVEPPKPMWEQERDDARRLHNFICARMGVPMPDKKKDRTEDSGGFTPMSLVSLEDKLDTLHNYLQATAAFTARTGHGGVAMLKYRQVKRFGSIMRSRISGAQPHSSNNSNSSGNSTSPRSSFSHVIPS